MSAKPVRVGIVGSVGWAGRRHMWALADAGAQVVALVDPDPRVDQLATRVGASVVPDAAGLAALDIDLAVVSLPLALQPPVCAELLGAGIRVLSEKPVAASAQEAQLLASIPGVEERLMVGYTLHHHPAAPMVREWVRSADVIGITVRTVSRKQTVDSWRANPGAGGALVVNGIHAIELISSWLPGTPQVTAAMSSSALYGSQVPEYTQATAAFPTGELVHMETYWSPWDNSQGLNQGDWDLSIDIVATQGRLVWRNHTVSTWARGESERATHFKEQDLFERQAIAALDFARGGPPTVGFTQALRATAIADAIAHATVTKETVTKEQESQR